MKQHTVIVLLSALLCSGTAMAGDCVVLLHGLARTSKSMGKLATALQEENYNVVNYQYPSREYTIESLAQQFVPAAVEQCGGAGKIHFVTHSLGGILLRQYQEANDIPHIHRTVMIGPPNKGSQVVDNLRNVPGFKFVNGEAGLQLGTTDQDIPPQLGPAKNEIGIIAGNRTINVFLSLYLPNPDDGKVSVENTKLEGMKDHLVVNVSHPFLMKNDEVIRQVIFFLKNGIFNNKEI